MRPRLSTTSMSPPTRQGTQPCRTTRVVEQKTRSEHHHEPCLTLQARTIATPDAEKGAGGRRSGTLRGRASRRADRRAPAPGGRRARIGLGAGRGRVRGAGRVAADDRAPGLRGARRRRASRHRRVVRRGRRADPRAVRPHPSLRGSRARPGGARHPHRRGRGLHDGGAHQRQRVAPRRLGGRSCRARARPPEPDRDLAADRCAVRRPHRLLVAPPAGPRPRAGPVACRGGLRVAARAALRDLRRGRVGTTYGGRRARDVDGPRGDRRRENVGSRWSGSRR